MVCTELGMGRKTFHRNFLKAYGYHKDVVEGRQHAHVEAAWEFIPDVPGAGEIILPNTGRVLLAGHCYNVYDRYANGDIMKKLDQLGFEVVTEKAVTQREKEKAVEALKLIKKPFWESLVRILGTILCLQSSVEGIIYLSSFSCGPDAVIIEMIRSYAYDIPMMVLKLDEHRGEAGTETRIEAFTDLLIKRRAT